MRTSMSNVLAGTEHRCSEIACLARNGDCFVHDGDRMRIFRARIDVTFGRADRDPGNRHALDEHKGIAFHDHAIGEGTAVAFIRIADDVFLRSASYRAPSAI